jgi:hypothetical protein
MNAFIVEVRNTPGELARIAGALGDAGVNITTGAGLGLDSVGGFGFLTDDEAGAQKALDSAGVIARTVSVIVVNVADQPGALADVARRLADAQVNVELVVPTSMGGSSMGLAVGVDDADAARTALGDLVSDG